MNYNLTLYHLALIAGGFTILGALLGNWISHRFTDYRDRRKEFNDNAQDIFIKLSDEKNFIAIGKGVTKIDLAIFRQKLSWWKTRSFDKCVNKYYGTKRENRQKEAENNFHGGTPAIIEAIDDLIKFTKRR